MIEWIKDHGAIVAWTTGASILILIASMVAASVVILRIPPDYFAHSRRPKRDGLKVPGSLSVPVRVLKNVLGAILVVAGAVMLVVPGQGVLTMLIGLFLLDVPGKYRLEKKVVARPRVLKALNWFRRRHDRQPLRMEEAAG